MSMVQNQRAFLRILSKMKIKLEKRLSGTFFLSLKPDNEDEESQLQSILKKQKRENFKTWITTETNNKNDKIETMNIDLREEE